MARNFGLKSKSSTPQQGKENDLKGRQGTGGKDMGGKQGEQGSVPKPPTEPPVAEHDEDLGPNRSKTNPDR